MQQHDYGTPTAKLNHEGSTGVSVPVSRRQRSMALLAPRLARSQSKRISKAVTCFLSVAIFASLALSQHLGGAFVLVDPLPRNGKP